MNINYQDPHNLTLYKKFNTGNMSIDMNFFIRQVARGRMNASYLLKLPFIFSELQDVYPDKWNMHIWPHFNSLTRKFQIVPMAVIKFDKITIVNSHNRHVVIEDLYVAFIINFDNNRIRVSNFAGTRGKITPLQELSGYLHSHLTSKAPGTTCRYHNFCTGSGGMSEAITMVNTTFTAPLFKLFLLQINEYVRWESLEGGPHKRMEHIISGQEKFSLKISNLELIEIFKKISEQVHYKIIRIVENEGAYKIEPTEELKLTIGKLLEDKYLVRIGPDGKEYPVDIKNVDVTVKKVPYTDIVWNKEHLVKVQIVPSATSSEYDKYPISGLMDVIINHLETKITNIVINE